MAGIEFADRRTWPPALKALWSKYREFDEEDLWDMPAARFHEALSGRPVVLYHATRMTPREVEDVRTNGLRLLTPELAQERIENAVLDGHLTPDEGRFYATSRCARSENRRGRVWCFADRRGLREVGSTIHLLRIWGGEGINQAWNTRSEESRRLWDVGLPTVIVVAIDAAWPERMNPGWMSALVLGQGADVMFTRPIPAECVQAVHHPGSDFWSRHVGWDGT